MTAAAIAPSKTEYAVRCKHNHKTLEEGDIVIMVEAPGYNNCLLRKIDFSLHSLQDKDEHYVCLELVNTMSNPATEFTYAVKGELTVLATTAAEADQRASEIVADIDDAYSITLDYQRNHEGPPPSV